VEMAIEISELIWQVVSIWNDVETFLSELFLHFYNVGAKPVLTGEFETVRKMINLLILVKVIVNVSFV